MSELLEKILCDENIAEAQKRVYANKGAKGVDGVTVQDLSKYMDENWTRIAQEIRERKYKPQPVLRVEISKLNGGVRKLGIPTVVDRVIEQALTVKHLIRYRCLIPGYGKFSRRFFYHGDSRQKRMFYIL